MSRARSPEERYAALVEALLKEPRVTHDPPRAGTAPKFGSGALKSGGRIFAMLTRARLVVKLPRARVDQLVAAGRGRPFEPRRDGRLMREWLDLEPGFEEDWTLLAREALEFVGGRH